MPDLMAGGCEKWAADGFVENDIKWGTDQLMSDLPSDENAVPEAPDIDDGYGLELSYP
jgi:hypothetical protein